LSACARTHGPSTGCDALVLCFGALLRVKSVNGAKTGALVLVAMVADAVMDCLVNVRRSDHSAPFLATSSA
jgi:hypothetical protein